MFDISFFELMLCAIVALVVIGPERLPETVRAVSLWIGRLKRSLRETRGELERQLGADDIRRQLHNEEVMQSLERTRREIENAMGHGKANSIKAIESKPETYAEFKELPDHAHMEEPNNQNSSEQENSEQTVLHPGEELQKNQKPEINVPLVPAVPPTTNDSTHEKSSS